MEVLLGNLPWMAWNLVLAAIPAALSLPLFGRERKPSVLWWLGAVAFLAFLPNAPYVLTDVIHFIDQVRAADSDLFIAFGLIPQYLVFCLAGFGCYAVSLIRLRRWLRARGWSPRSVLGTELVLHALCTVGVFLGRVFRFNSWDLLDNPDAIADVIRIPRPTTAVVLALTFLTLTIGTAVFRLLARDTPRLPA